ncbi:TRAP transporter small permease [Martelella sp. AD-3]|uniref:TRAP transporter small permease n=1 Tax=Martelella sp. AD-3 TaxID=686597 RepID=UPI000464991B|nr:TRAP transporter small permease [Martelella sp. AD-3]AMM83092.1 C4-dicarboxylate ABC transporter permease [Martelella sp. AD-3]MAM13602.1 TRAP transporter small permease [Rhizobiaceae bacterium]
MPGFLAKIEFVAGAILLAVITVLVFIAATMRFFGYPLIWSVDLAQLLFIWLCFIGATRAMRERGHLGVDYLVRPFPYRYRLALETGLSALFIAFLLLLAVEGYDLTMLNKERQFGDSGLSYAWVTIAVPAGCVMLTISILGNLVQAWRSAKGDRLLVFTRTAAEDEAVIETGAAE